MNRRKLAFQLILLFAACVLVYALLFKWIEGRRVAKGPWTVTFVSEAGGRSLEVAQTNLNIQRVVIRFPNEPSTTNGTRTIAFAEARKVPYDLPFGQCVFQDTLFQPGTVAMKLFGHEIQLMPRVLTIDGKERPWRDGDVIELKR